MASKESILNKIQILITNHFETPEKAFEFFDEDGDGKLQKSEVVALLKQAKISGFIRGIVATRLMEAYDASEDEYIDWEEFKAAIAKINASV
ncbi:MAG: EF-hand domain-containing protein [Croceitalea sp.]|nr:EF-hand domain-containing protein [Croceitalea sp.]MBT8238669.1 EF-hand domain-containing protein [Croceitalea sp.]NNC33471.1 EF-hand domain-containing protein [Croceitalea sp.]NNL08458.1 EF-hand domain-containing protein [Croceitalea sp.]NNM18005.1 EF-hand domain-containing protein [Croceitalea sp.]